MQIGKDIEPELKKYVIGVVCQYHDVFVWGPKDMPGLDLSVAQHKINVDPEAKSVKEKKRTFAMER